MDKTTAVEARYSISEAAKLLDRSPHTLRSWDRNGSMPASLRPKRDALGHRYWTPALIQQIKEWIQRTGFHPGRGIDYHPTQARLQQHIDKIRHAARANGKLQEDPQVAGLRQMVREAIVDLKVDPDVIVASLPKVISTMSIPLDRALEVAAEVIHELR